MFTSFEQYAATQMLGQPDSPPKNDGRMYFSAPWQRTVFGLAMALAKAGHFEGEEFRQELIVAIAGWEHDACGGQTTWDYYECYAAALLRLLERRGLIPQSEPNIAAQ
jgi:nitrile hydratase accessory protein